MSLHQKSVTVPEVISLSLTDKGEALRELTIRQIFSNARGYTSDGVITRLTKYGLPHAGGEKLRSFAKPRVRALLGDATHPIRRVPPTSHFPFTPLPPKRGPQ
jgi:hypothetical protein